MVKKNKSERGQDFRADMQTIKREDIRKLQATFSQVFGKSSDEMRKQSLKLKKKIYFLGFVATTFFVLGYYFTKNVNFVAM